MKVETGDVSSRSSATDIEITTTQSKQANLLKRLYRRSDKGLLALCIVFVLTLPLFTARIYASDEIQYFSYLHSAVFDQDVNFTNEYQHFIALDPKKNENIKNDLLDKKNENNLPVNVAPIGSALLWSPFYLATHGVVSLAHAVGIRAFNPDGYSPPYILAVSFASLLYGFIGLILCYLLIRNFIPRLYAALATITVWLATPIIFYMSLTPPMSHANSLFVISLWMYVWYRTRGWQISQDGQFVAGQRSFRAWLLLGVLGGLMYMVREQDGTVVVVAGIEALYCYWQWVRGRDWRQVGQLIARNAVFALGLLIGLVPQLLAYQWLNGHPSPTRIVQSKLLWLDPKVFGQFVGLMLDPDHGMLWWSPVLLPALVGLVLLLRRRELRFIGVVLLAAFVVEWYISASFQTWTMKGSFGARRMLGVSGVYVLGLGYLFYWLAEARKGWHIGKRWLIAVATLFVIWNFGLIVQFSAIRTPEDRQNLNPARVVHDQFLVVPGKLVSIAQKFLVDRSGFYKK